jgi:hypothetical protein
MFREMVFLLGVTCALPAHATADAAAEWKALSAHAQQAYQHGNFETAVSLLRAL